MNKKTLILNNTPLNEKLIFNILENAKNYDILIINYNVDNLNIGKLNEISENYNFNSFDVYLPTTKNIDEIKSKISSLRKESIVFFIGLEKIFLNTSLSDFQIKNGTKLFNYHSYENINISKLIIFIEDLYKEFNLNFLFLIQTNLSVSNKIYNYLEKYDIEILIINYENDDNEDLPNQILKELLESNYEKSLILLEKYKSDLSEASVRNLQVIIWQQHGFQDKAIKFLKENFEILNDNEKKQLADFYYFEEKYHESFIIVSTIFKKNPLIVGLNDLYLNIAIKLNKFDEVWEQIINVDSQDIKVLEICADYFVKKEIFDKAIEFRDKLFSITNDPFQLLLIEILKIEKNTPLNGHLAEKQISDALSKYNDEKLDIEKSYKLGRIWFEIYKSPFKAYYHFKDVLKICDNNHSVDASKYRMKLLKNHRYSSQIFKEGYQLKYPDKLPMVRINELFNSLLILTQDDLGYLTWQSFIDNSQTIQVWKKYLTKKTIKILKDIDKDIDINDIDKSIMANKFKDNKLIKLVIMYKSASFSQEQIETIKKASESFIAQATNKTEEIWLRYYIANFFIYTGEMQLVNNHSISLWYLANRIDNKDISKMARLLGTLSWGVAQYKNGKEIEGIACILVTIKYFIEMGEVVPFLEDGLGILNIWIQNNKSLFLVSDFDFFNKFFRRLTPTNVNQNEIYQYIYDEDWDSVCNLLGYNVYNTNDYTSQWALDFHHYVQATAKSTKLEIDFELIFKNIDNLINALIMRKDQRPKLLYSIAYIIFMKINKKHTLEERWKTSLKLLSVSIQDLEEKRKKLKNTYERAFISDENKMIYKLFLVNNIVLFKANLYMQDNEKIRILENILNGFDYLSLRTQKEKKINKSEAKITPELKDIERKYLQLIDDLSQYSTKNFKDAFRDKEYEEKSNLYSKLRQILEEQHPSYMNDSYYNEIPITVLQSKMMDDEIYYQYIEMEMFVCYLVVTKDFIDFNLINNKSKFDKKNVEKLAYEIQELTLSTKYNIQKIENIYYDLSLYYFEPLTIHIVKHNFKKVYINHDLSLPFISSNLIRLNDTWLINKVDSIVNLINRQYFLDRKLTKKSKFSLVNLGKKSNKQFIETNEWIERSELRQQLKIEDFENNINNISIKVNNNKTNSLLIVSHGNQGTKQNILTGALSIEGQKKTYVIDDFKFIDELECIFFLSCSGGSVSIGEIETSSSLINSILSKKINSVVLCRWDVFLKPSLEIIEKILELDNNIEEALNLAIKSYLKQNKELHPAFWAGMEVWKN